MSMDAYISAKMAGGNATYRDLKPGDRFHFPKHPDVIYVKWVGGWYDTAGGPYLRTGSKTAVVKL